MPLPTAVTTQDNAADAQALKQELDRVLREDTLNPVFQPIVSLRDGSIFGYEGLIRGPSNSPLHSPLALLQTADRFGQLIDVERVCRRTTLRRFSALGLDATVFVNVSPDSLLDPQLQPDSALALLAELGLQPERVVIELTEMRPILDYGAVRAELDRFKTVGVPVAIDDLGEGFATLRLWSELRPNFVKIDKHFISGLHLDPVKQQFVAAIQRIASESGTRTIAEGIELIEELHLVKKLGLDYAQGFFLGRPEAAPRTRIGPEALQVIRDGEQTSRSRNLLNRSNQIARNLLRDNLVVSLQTTNEQVYELFNTQPDLYSLTVLDARHSPVGVVRRAQLIEAFARPFARELYGKRSCTQLMDRHPLVVDASLSLAALSQLVVAADRRYLVDGFVITDNGRYIGVGTGHDLMRALTELQINAARYANPLTLLPGNVPINERIDELIEQDTPFVAVFADLNHFKPFNDVYGYPRGDDVIQLLGHLLIRFFDSERDFVG
ncbi:MAG: EAL domain-containing protein, partial [Burkholderiales bacterium]|nr:EAL domain-containing protein [Burkholderiales bacterium]